MKKKSAKIKKNQQYLPSASSQNDVSLSNITKNLTTQQGNHYELFGEDYKQGDVEGCVQDLLSVLREYSADGFRQVMFRQFIKNPMGMSYSKQDYVKTMSILRAAIAQTESENYPKSKTKLLYELEFYTYVFYENNKINTKMLEANAYFMRSLSQQMRMICTHIQDYALRMEAVIFEQQNRRPIAWADPLATTMPVNDIKKRIFHRRIVTKRCWIDMTNCFLTFFTRAATIKQAELQMASMTLKAPRSLKRQVF